MTRRQVGDGGSWQKAHSRSDRSGLVGGVGTGVRQSLTYELRLSRRRLGLVKKGGVVALGRSGLYNAKAEMSGGEIVRPSGPSL